MYNRIMYRLDLLLYKNLWRITKLARRLHATRLHAWCERAAHPVYGRWPIVTQ